MALVQPLSPSEVIGMNLTPTPDTYLDVYDFTTNDVPDVRNAAIDKFNNTITGFISKFSVTETLNGQKVYWAEQEKRAVTYEDAIWRRRSIREFTQRPLTKEEFYQVMGFINEPIP